MDMVLFEKIKKYRRRLVVKSMKAGRAIILGGSIVSCGSTQFRKSTPDFAKTHQKRTMKLELMRLWAKMEYSRFMGDEVNASLVERDYEILEQELTKLELEEEAVVSKR